LLALFTSFGDNYKCKDAAAVPARTLGAAILHFLSAFEVIAYGK
jgi:hypothetical protein